MSRLTVVCSSALLLCFFAGCATPHILPPRAAPPAVMPAVSLPIEQPAPQHGRVIIDATDGAMDVVAQRAEPFAPGVSASSVGALCRTPCVRDLPIGHYDLFFSGLEQDPSRGDRAPIDVREGVNVLLRAPGKYETPRAFQPVPLAFLMGGTALTVVGLSVGPAITSSEGSTIAFTAAIVGLVMVVTGLAVYDYQAEQQDGSSTYFQAAHPAAADNETSSFTAATEAR